jgi:hypothetical protein
MHFRIENVFGHIRPHSGQGNDGIASRFSSPSKALLLWGKMVKHPKITVKVERTQGTPLGLTLNGDKEEDGSGCYVTRSVVRISSLSLLYPGPLREVCIKCMFMLATTSTLPTHTTGLETWVLQECPES